MGAAGGEDFELCVCLGPDAAARVAGVTWVGGVVGGEPGVGVQLRGAEPFARRVRASGRLTAGRMLRRADGRRSSASATASASTV